MSKKHAIPGPFPVKIITHNSEGIRQTVLQAVKTVFPKCSEEFMRETTSGGDKYISFTVTLYVETEEQLTAMNQQLKAIPDVVMVL